MTRSTTRNLWLAAAAMALVVALVGGLFAEDMGVLPWAFVGVAAMFAVFAFTLDEGRS